uniref:Uncharacterized protein n=1 Tax=Glossina palpalis gambiensis TaxID=67801 RepID=A0A1B0BTF7_9MUSC
MNIQVQTKTLQSTMLCDGYYDEYDKRPKRAIIGTALHSFAVLRREIKEFMTIYGIIGDGKYILQNTLRLTSSLKTHRLLITKESLTVHVNNVSSAYNVMGSESTNCVPTIQFDPPSIEASSESIFLSLPAVSSAIWFSIVGVENNFRSVVDSRLTLYLSEKGKLIYSNSAVNRPSCFVVMPLGTLGMRILLYQERS